MSCDIFWLMWLCSTSRCIYFLVATVIYLTLFMSICFVVVLVGDFGVLVHSKLYFFGNQIPSRLMLNAITEFILLSGSSLFHSFYSQEWYLFKCMLKYCMEIFLLWNEKSVINLEELFKSVSFVVIKICLFWRIK